MERSTIYTSISTISPKNLISINTSTILWKTIYLKYLPSLADVMLCLDHFVRCKSDYVGETIEHCFFVEEDIQTHRTTYTFTGRVISNGKIKDNYNFVLTGFRSYTAPQGSKYTLITLRYTNAVFLDTEGIKTYQGRTSLHLVNRIVNLCNREEQYIES